MASDSAVLSAGLLTLKHILQGQQTLVQLEMLARADRLFANKAGRYFGGVLTSDQVETITKGLKLHD